MKDYDRSKYRFGEEISVLEYYIKLYQQSYGNDGNSDGNGNDNNDGNATNDNNDNQFIKTTKNLNLYSLYKQIDDKLLYNRNLL